MANDVTIELDNVAVEFPIYGVERSLRSALKATVGGLIYSKGDKVGRTYIQALKDISLTIRSGDRVGIVGGNGAGKSTLLQVVAGGYYPSSGAIRTYGKITSLLNMGVGLDPEESGYDNIQKACLYYGLSMREIRALTPDIVDFCELGPFLYMPLRTYSSGMSVRLAFAIATALNPEILVVDEIIGAGDASFAAKAQKRVQELMHSAHTLLLASHADETIRQFCNKGLFMKAGEVQFFGDVDEALKRYAEFR